MQSANNALVKVIEQQQRQKVTLSNGIQGGWRFTISSAGIKTNDPLSNPKDSCWIFFSFVPILLACEYAAFYFLPTWSTRFRNASAYQQSGS